MKNFNIFNSETLLIRVLILGIFVSSFNLLDAQTSKEYTDADVATFVTDLEAGTYDTLILSTSGGIYDVAYPDIPQTTVIMGKEGLAAKPVLKNTANASTSQSILRANGSSVRDTITFINLEFDGSGAATPPMIIKSEDETHLVLRDCYIHDGTQGNGVIQMRNAGSTLDMQNTLVTKSNSRVICLYTTGALYGDINLKNCTFSGATGGDVVYFRSASGVYAAGDDVSIDHCTFYNITGNITRYQADSIHGTVSVTNSIFEQVSGDLDADVIDYNYLAGLGTPPTGSNTIVTAPVFADESGENFTLTNKEEMTGGDLQILGDLSWYDDTYPPKVLEELIKVDQTHVRLQFNESVDKTTASAGANYTLSGTGGLTGNPSEAVLDANGKEVTLTVDDLSGMQQGETIIVTVSNVKDLNDNVITGDNVATYTLVDETSPHVTMETQAVSNDAGQTAAAQSNEAGIIYLVHVSAAQTSIEDLEAAIASRMGSKANVITPDVDVAISTASLGVGEYYAYAVDAYDNISEKSTNAVTVSDNSAPSITMAAQEVSNGGIETVAAQSNEPGMIYLILDGEAQSSVAEFETAISAGKGTYKSAPKADEDISISVNGIEPGSYYGYAVDDAGNISSKSTNAVTVTTFVPRIRYYEESEAAALEDDLVAALNGDVFILTTSGGNYAFGDWVNISAKITIMASEDVAERPVLSIYKESNTVQIMRLFADGASIHAKGLEFDSKSRAPGLYPPKYAIRSNANIGNYSLVLEDCYFHGTWQANDGSNGAILKLYDGTFADSVIIRNCIFEGDEGIVFNSSAGPFTWDKFEISNCTFMNIPDDQAILIIQKGEHKTLPLSIDHCTFSNVGGINEEVIRIDSLYAVTLTNSIFGTSTADTSWHLFGDLSNQAMVDYVNFFECPEPLTDQGGTLGTNKWAYDPQFADTANGDLTLGNATLLNLGSDGLPLGDLRWADIFGPKVQTGMTARSDTTLLLKFDEWIDTTTAEIAGNYALSGSAGLSGNVKKAELFNFNSVLLTVESFATQAGNEIIVTVSNVEDLKGNVVDPANNSATYTVEELRPVVTADAQNATNGVDQVVIAQSNLGTGLLYIVLEGEAQSNLAELDIAVAAKKGAKASVSAAYTDTEIGVSGIEPGTYYAYATDLNETLSVKGENAITITDGIPPVITLAIQSVPNGKDNMVLAQSNELGKIYIVKDGEKQNSENDFISAIYSKKGAKADVTTVDTDVEVPSKDLIPGIYYGYAVDAAGNISEKSSNPINITLATSLEGMDDPNLKVYSFGKKIVIESTSSEIDRVGIYDLTGRTIISKKISSDRHEFLMVRQGVYFVRILSDNQKIQTIKLIVH